MTAKAVAIVALPGVQLLDVSGPLDVFAEANAQSGKSPYSLMVIAAEPGPMMITSMPDSRSSRRRLSDKPSGPNFDAQ